jgi:hypothetical protein
MVYSTLFCTNHFPWGKVSTKFTYEEDTDPTTIFDTRTASEIKEFSYKTGIAYIKMFLDKTVQNFRIIQDRRFRTKMSGSERIRNRGALISVQARYQSLNYTRFYEKTPAQVLI